MTGVEYLTSMKTVAYLCGCAVNGAAPEKSKLEGTDFDLLYDSAKNHLLAAAVGMALESAGIREDRFVQAVAQAQRKNALLDADRARVLTEMEKAGIWYMPLKGAILKDYYPRYGMRQMADNDILFDATRAEDVRRIMEGLGFSTKHFGQGNHDVYYKQPVSNFEMHRRLFDDRLGDNLYKYFASIQKRMIRDPGKEYGYHLSDEDFYIYLISHEYKHYSGGGTGLRSLLDTYVYLKKVSLDMEYVKRETKKIGTDSFEEANRKLALDLFDGNPLDGDEEEMLDYILSSGTYGTLKNSVQNQINNQGKWKYFFSRMSLPIEAMQENYPVMRKAPWLYPVFWAWRLISKLFTSHSKFVYEVKSFLKGKAE